MYQIMCQPGNGVLAEAFALCHFLSARRPVGTPAVRSARPPTGLQGPDARRRGAQPQDSRRRPQDPGAGGSRSAPRRQEGDRRPPPGEGRERCGMGTFPRQRSRTNLRRPRDDSRRWRPGLAGGPAHRVPRCPGSALPGSQNQERPRQGSQSRKPSSRVCTLSLSTAPRHGAPPDVSPHAGEMPAPKPSPACATISR